MARRWKDEDGQSSRAEGGDLTLGVFSLYASLEAIPAAEVSVSAFAVDDSQLRSPSTLIVYGNMRFTDAADISATNPKVRRWLVDQVAKESPDAVLVSGDIPLSGSVQNNYAVFKTETAIWRDTHLRVFPALGKHELNGDPSECLENWWRAFPELRGSKWYSVQFGVPSTHPPCAR
jgi:hypothetical protein